MKTSEALTIPLMSGWEKSRKGGELQERRRGELGKGTKEKSRRKQREGCWQSLKAEGFPTEQGCRQQIINNNKFIFCTTKSPYFGPDLCAVIITVTSMGALQLIKGCLQPSIFIPAHQPGYMFNETSLKLEVPSFH